MRRLALFARMPEIGRALPRLSPALPPAAAAALAGGMLEDAIETMRGAASADERFLWWAGSEATLFTRGTGEEAETGEALGGRLASALPSLLQTEGDRGLIFAGDCPALGVAGIDAAFAALDGADVVLAPARAGGLALLGLARNREALFREVEWHPARLATQMAERAEALGLSVATLVPEEALDDPESLCRLVAAAVVPGTRVGPNTRGALSRLGMIPAPLLADPAGRPVAAP